MHRDARNARPSGRPALQAVETNHLGDAAIAVLSVVLVLVVGVDGPAGRLAAELRQCVVAQVETDGEKRIAVAFVRLLAFGVLYVWALHLVRAFP